MTIEEKAKRYDEALERAKSWAEGKVEVEELGASSKSVAEFIFPELKESEDEGIRKSLINFLTAIKIISESGRTSWAVRKEDAEMCKSFLAYLERQKEQKPSALQDAFEHSVKDYSLEEKSKASNYADRILPTSVIYGENEEEYKLHKIMEAAFIAGQKEQKPVPFSCGHENGAEWSEEETPVEKERRRLKGDLKEEVCASDVCAYRGKNVCTVKRDEYCPMFKSKEDNE